MGKHIPIDDLFREKLSGSEEQLNLGAWANMERMLDGKNPYAKDEETKRKRRILPFFILFTVLVGTISAGYYKISQKTNHTAPVELAQSEPLRAQNESIVSDENQVVSTNQESQPIAKEHRNVSKTSTTKVSTSNKVSKANTAISSVTKKTTKDFNNKNIQTQQKNQSSQIDQNSDIETLASINTDVNHDVKKSNKKVLVSNKNDKQIDEVKTKVIGKVKQIEVNQVVKNNRDGSINMTFDTVAITNNIIETEQTEFIVSEKNKTANENFHPRYKKLTTEEENQMLQVNQTEIQSATVLTKTNSAQTSPSLTDKNTISKTIKKPESQGFFDKLRTFASKNYQKMATATVTALNLNAPWYPGLSIGVNNAVFNPENNFGGFHIGVTNIKPISESFSILTELKLFSRNNSGYTIKDISTSNKPVSKDDVTLASQNKSIYSYAIDSSVTGYNFKSFTSLEMPVMFQALIGNSVMAYGGINMAYNFRLNIKEVKTNYLVNKEEILDNSITFAPQNELGKKYTRDDFSSRFGLGYTVGASYNFNPNIYLDLRLTKNVWDNAQTNSAKEISNKYFTVPNIQFSLGYRFRKFDPKR